MPPGLKRYRQEHHLHFISFTCFYRAAFLQTASARDMVVHTLERVRVWYGFYVVMPEHVHLLISEPGRGSLALALQMLKQIVSGKLRRVACGEPLWQGRYYDFNVWSDRKRVEKLSYIHENPVRRGLVERREDWRSSSFRHYASGEEERGGD
jgi:putative transposase